MIVITEEYLPSRLGISPCREHFRMELFARGITGNREKSSPTNNRPFCIQTNPPVETVCNLETRPQQYRDQYNATKLNLGLDYAFPPFCMIRHVLAKVIREKVNHLVILTQVWHIQPWHAQLLCILTQIPLLVKSFCEFMESNA